MKKIILILLFSISLYPQTDYERWWKKENPYLQKDEIRKRDYALKGDNVIDLSAKLFVMGYWFFISDLDGDNCPFTPTCSSFLLQASRQTNIIKASLMFGDRFMRDANIFGRDEHYPYIIEKHYYDPPSLYMMNKKGVIMFLKNQDSGKR